MTFEHILSAMLGVAAVLALIAAYILGQRRGGTVGAQLAIEKARATVDQKDHVETALLQSVPLDAFKTVVTGLTQSLGALVSGLKPLTDSMGGYISEVTDNEPNQRSGLLGMLDPDLVSQIEVGQLPAEIEAQLAAGTLPPATADFLRKIKEAGEKAAALPRG